MCGNIVSDISNGINNVASQTANAVNNVAEQVTNPITRPDSITGQTLIAGGNVMRAPFEAVYDVSRGDITHAETTLGRGLGGAAFLGSGGTSYFLADNYIGDTAKSLPYVGTHLGPAVGTSRAVRDLNTNGYTSKENWSDVGRFAGQAAVIGAGGYYFGSQGAGTAVARTIPSAGTKVGLPTLTLPEVGAGAGAWLQDEWNKRQGGGSDSVSQSVPQSAPSQNASALALVAIGLIILKTI